MGRRHSDTASFEVIGEVSNFLAGTLIIYIAVGLRSGNFVLAFAEEVSVRLTLALVVTYALQGL
ncbi:hypothetical protein PSCICL_47730 [Pseudomonas cichorii]|nr:hypothetical protein PSCICL_47730 [Pseudomonas cichorii]